MKKLVSEIAGKSFPPQKYESMFQKDVRLGQIERCEEIITAKLRPVKALILELLTASLVGCDGAEVQYICPPAFDKAIRAAAELAPQFGMAITERGVGLVRSKDPSDA